MTALWHLIRSWFHRRKLLKCMGSEAAEGFLELLFGFMDLVFRFDRRFKRSIEGGFHGKYLFASRDGAIGVRVVFSDGEMTFDEQTLADPDVKIVFKDEKALMGYLLSPHPDILGSMLRQDVVVEGNLNYMYKLAYMAMHLRHEFGLA